MGRILKKKTDNQKLKLRDKQKQKSDAEPGAEGSSEASKDSPLKEAAKRAAGPKKTDESKKTMQNQEPGYYQKIEQFFREVKAELKKVVWPPKNQAVASTVVVIVLVSIVSSLLGIFDLFLKGLIQMVLK